jgi:hypothetical protein
VVLGERGTDVLSLSAAFPGPDEDALADLVLRHDRRGETLRVETRAGRSKGRVNLALTVPPRLEVLIDDGSGSVRVAGIEGAVSIEDGSGSISVENLGGDLSVKDGSGAITAEHVAGAVRIDDGRGSIAVRAACGDVTARDDSGSITVRDVDGRFHLASDSSGPVSTSGIRGGVDGLS